MIYVGYGARVLSPLSFSHSSSPSIPLVPMAFEFSSLLCPLHSPSATFALSFCSPVSCALHSYSLLSHPPSLRVARLPWDPKWSALLVSHGDPKWSAALLTVSIVLDSLWFTSLSVESTRPAECLPWAPEWQPGQLPGMGSAYRTVKVERSEKAGVEDNRRIGLWQEGELGSVVPCEPS